MTEREDGFYWVKPHGVWLVASYDRWGWWIPGSEDNWNDSELDEIDERRIVRTEPEASV